MPPTAPRLVESFRRVVWQLRNYWVSDATSALDPQGRVVVKTPILGSETDFGVLLYREVASRDASGRDRSTLVAPRLDLLTVDVLDGLVSLKAPAQTPRTTPSYLFYNLDAASRSAMHRGDRLAFGVGTGDPAHYKGVSVTRTADELFLYVSPTPESTYTPKDEIPFAVDFLGAGDGPYRADQFAVSVALTRMDAQGNPNAAPIVLELDQPGAVPNRFSRGFVRDPAPESAGIDIKGVYRVDVTIRATGGPLKGASRRFVRRRVVIGDYPRLLAGHTVTLSNQRGGSTGTASASLDLKTTPSSSVAWLSAAPGGGISGLVVTPKTVGTVGKSQEFIVKVPAQAWSGLKNGPHLGGFVRIAAPWRQAVDVPIVLNKTPFSVSLPQERVEVTMTAQHDPTAKPSPLSLLASLATDLDLGEPAILVDPEMSTADPSAGRTFRNDSGQTIVLSVSGLNSPATLYGGTAVHPAPFVLALSRGSGFAKGRYSRTFEIRGDSVSSSKVDVVVVVDEPEVQALGADGQYHKITELVAPGLAGSQLKRSLKVQSSFGTYEVQGLELRPTSLTLPGPGDVLADVRTTIRPGTGGDFDLDVAIPSRVVEGSYRANLKLTGRTRLGESPFTEFYLPLLVNVQVAHRGVRVLEGTRLALPVSPPGSTKSSAIITLASDVKGTTIRWSAELAPGQGPVPKIDLLALDTGRADGRKQYHTALSTKSAANPLLADGHALELKVEADGVGLAPGIYTRKIDFYASDPVSQEKGKASFTLAVEQTVSGRVVHAAVPNVPGVAEIGQETLWTVRVDPFGCNPGIGVILPPRGSVSKTQALVADPKNPGTFLVRLRPDRAGLNKFLLLWDRLDDTRKDEPPPADPKVKIEDSRYVQEILIERNA